MKKTILINISLILTFFLIFEFFLRVLDLSSLRGLSESYSKNNRNLEGKAFGEKFYTDQYGYRVPNKNYLYDKKKDNIILIGDSFVFGPGIIEEKTFSGKLRTEKTNFNIYNSAKPGDQINDYYFQIKNFIKNYDDNKFIIFVNFDDINILQKKEKNTDGQKKDFVENLRNIKLLNKVNIFFRSKLHSYVWLVGVTTDPSKRYYNNVNIKFKDELIFNQFTKEIKKINDLFKDKKVKKIFLITPYSYQMRSDCGKTNFTPQNKLKKIFIDNKINFYDFTKVFCEESKNKKLFINFDPTHLSEHGHNIIFDYIKKF